MSYLQNGWVLAFESEESLLQAVKRLMKEDGLNWEVCAPYPCSAVRLANRHAGKAVGSSIRMWAITGGLGGLLSVALWIYVTQWCADPLITQGRVQGLDSWPAYIPALFEGTLLGAGLLTAIGFLKESLLPKWHDRAFDCDFFRTDEHGNGYFILLATPNGEDMTALIAVLQPCLSEWVGQRGGVS